MRIGKSSWLSGRAALSTILVTMFLLGVAATQPAHAADWTYTNCSATQQATAVNARQTSFKWMDKLQASMPYVQSQKDPASAQFNTWMGGVNRDSSLMKSAFNGIQGYLDNPKVTADCQNTPVCAANPTAIAYTTVDTAATPLTVHLCPPFFTAPANDQANTIIHELAHRASKLIDDQTMPAGAPDAGEGAYGPVDVQWLAANRPEMAVKNADNYSFLAEMMYPVKLK